MKRTFDINDEIRGLSWYEPYGSLMLYGGKQETRKNPTNVRGWILICNTKKPCDFNKLKEFSGSYQMTRIREILYCKGISYKNGVALSIGYLSGCRQMTKDDENLTFVKYKEPWIEINKTGDEVLKRLWVWEFTDVFPIEPFEISGSQGWSILTPEQKQLIKPL